MRTGSDNIINSFPRYLDRSGFLPLLHIRGFQFVSKRILSSKSFQRVSARMRSLNSLIRNKKFREHVYVRSSGGVNSFLMKVFEHKDVGSSHTETRRRKHNDDERSDMKALKKRYLKIADESMIVKKEEQVSLGWDDVSYSITKVTKKCCSEISKEKRYILNNVSGVAKAGRLVVCEIVVYHLHCN